MVRKIKRFFGMAVDQRQLFLQSAILLPLTGLGVRLLGFNRWYAGLSRRAVGSRISATTSPQPEVVIIQRTLRSVRLASQHGLYPGNCLSRSLTLWWLLRRQGIECDLRIGVRREQAQLQGHAWIEYKGYPLNEQPQVHQHYAVFAETILPADRWESLASLTERC